MEALQKLSDMAEHMALEPAEELRRAPAPTVAPCGIVVEEKGASTRPSAKQKREQLGIFHAAMPGGKSIPLLKTMLTSACERDCHYCPFRAGRNYRRTTFQPEEMAGTFMDMQRAGMVDGLFLSSGIIGGGAKTQDKLLDTLAILRRKHQFRGYIHLKIMPGAQREQVYEAMRLADRLSINLEAPNDGRLLTLAPLKQFAAELLQPLQWVEEIRRAEAGGQGWNGRWPSTTTQFVVGAAGESDLELLSTSEYLFHKLNLARTYYSAFSPVKDTPLENHTAEDPMRQHRLYQASFLFRDYGFDLEDLPFDQGGNLPLAIDPKLAWARENLSDAPIELNRAARQELLRVPGIGPLSASRIIEARRRGALRDLRDLQALGVATGPLAPYVLLSGKRPGAPAATLADGLVLAAGPADVAPDRQVTEQEQSISCLSATRLPSSGTKHRIWKNGRTAPIAFCGAMISTRWKRCSRSGATSSAAVAWPATCAPNIWSGPESKARGASAGSISGCGYPAVTAMSSTTTAPRRMRTTARGRGFSTACRGPRRRG